MNAWSADLPSLATDKLFAAESKVDILAYHEAGLPDPAVIYVYGSDGRLIRVLGADGDNGRDGMKIMEASIASGEIAVDAEKKPLDEKFRKFLMDQGLQVKKLISDKHKYTLILLLPDTNGAPCPPCLHYRAMLAGATATPSSEGKFFVYTLKLGAPGQSFRVVE